MSERPFYDVGNVGNKNLSIHNMIGSETSLNTPSWSFRHRDSTRRYVQTREEIRDILYSPIGGYKPPKLVDPYLKTAEEVLRGYPDPDRYFSEKAEEKHEQFEKDQKEREARVDTWAIEERDFKIKTALIFIVAIVVVVGGFAVQIIW